MNKWEQWEIDILKTKPYSEHLKLLPNRSYCSINHKRCKLGLFNEKHWTEEEIQILKNNSFSDAKKILKNRTITSLHHKRNRMGISHEKLWTDQEVKVLKETTCRTNKQIKELLPNRSEMSICRKLTHLKIKKDRVALLRNKSSNRSGLSLEKIDSIAVDNKFNEIIDGCLLGDGSATRGGFCYSSVSEQHVKFVYDILSVFGFNNKIYKIKSNCTEIKLRNKAAKPIINPSEFYYSYQIRSRIIFPSIRKRWYPSGVKIVPEDVRITKLSCLLWYLGDGTLARSNSGQSLILTLCTNGFTIEDHKILKKKLKKEANIKSIISKTGRIKYNNDIEYTLKLYGVNAYRFLKYIGPCTVNDYKHKWNIGKCKMFTKNCHICGKKTEYVSDNKYKIKYRCVKCRNKWTKEKVISFIQSEYKKPLELQMKNIATQNQALYLAGKRFFKTWKKALTAAGIDYEKARNRKLWSAESVLEEIKQIYRGKGKSYQKLRDAARHYFGSFTEAKKLAGVLQ